MLSTIPILLLTLLSQFPSTETAACSPKDFDQKLNKSEKALLGKIKALEAKLDASIATLSQHTPPVVDEGEYDCPPSDHNKQDGDWRRHTQTVKFTKAFKTPPLVSVSLVNLDMFNGIHIRYGFYARKVTAADMELVCETWADSIYSWGKIRWVAIET
ncbi:uncharacterized protein LOC131940160 [Physella acuta]|uniref:uncharacterized protein LOC131940160 n=1 Tax=Physella acuta TaxID=109671 RepID=UPI0027DBB1E0|nr:uncharacterized protein LOC131940160 [Physella acuta]